MLPQMKLTLNDKIFISNITYSFLGRYFYLMIELQNKLEKAIEEERYEDAIEIQKQIDELRQLYKSFFED